jgi:Tfp pilus assembly protein PilN
MFNLDSALGVEIREGRIVLAAVQKGFQGFILKRHAVIEDCLDLPRPELVARVQQFLRKNGVNRENVVVGLPRDSVVVREVEFPIEVEENLDQVVRSQVDRFEPADELRSAYDYRVVSRDEETRRLLLQIVMARREMVDDYLNLFEECELYPAAIRFSSEGLEGALLAHEDGFPKKQGVLILRLEPGYAEFVASSREHSYSEAWTLEGEVQAEELLDRIAELLSHQSDRIPGFSKLYLVGEGAPAGLDQIRDRIGDCGLLTEGLALKAKELGTEVTQTLVVAVGLAISGVARGGRPFNLIPVESRRSGTRPGLAATYVLGALLVILLGAIVTRGYFQQSVLAAQVEAQVEGLQSEMDGAFQLREEVVRKRAELEEIQSLISGRQKLLLVLRDLTERIPDDAYLQNLQEQGGQISIQGYSDQASALLPVLLESPYLEGVKTNWIVQDPRMAGKERFNIAARIREQP